MTPPRTELTWVLSNNSKTGVVPTAYVGTTRDEARASCQGCPMLGDRTCYAWGGTPRMAFSTIVKARRRDPSRYSLGAVMARLARRRRGRARVVRLGALGDPARARRRDIREALSAARTHGMTVLGYTHAWRTAKARDMRGTLMASCDTPTQADEALRAGWRPAAIIPAAPAGPIYQTPGGARLLVCPAQRKPDTMTCDRCAMCSPSAPVWTAGRIDGIAFIPHGVARKRLATLTCDRGNP